MKLGTKNRIRRVLEKGWGQRWSSAVLVRLWKEIGVFDGLLWYLMRKTTGGRSSERLQRSRVVEALGEPMLSLGSEAGDGSLFYAVGRETFLWLKIKGGVLSRWGTVTKTEFERVVAESGPQIQSAASAHGM